MIYTGYDDDTGYKNDRNPVKFGKCTWCKAFGNLNNYSSNLQGREIYCTGLCSKKCFEQAALKILNVEAGYGLESSAFPESVPIRTSLENLDRRHHESRDRHRDRHSREQSHFEPNVSHFDATRHYSGFARNSETARPTHVVKTPPSNVTYPASASIRAPMWNIENVKSLRSTEPSRTSKQGNYHK